jgi:hypothetical protein
MKKSAIALIILIFIQFNLLTSFVSAQLPKEKKVKNATLQVLLYYSNTGEVVLRVRKLKASCYEPEEMGRLLSHWYSKIEYLLKSIMPRMFLLKEVQDSLFEPKLKPKENVLKKAKIDDVVKIVENIKQNKIVSSINLYLKEFPSSERGLISYFKGDGTEQQTVFSWAIILQYASQNYSKKDISFIHDIMGETVKAYSAGADPDAVENIAIIPSNAYFKVKKNR